MQARAELVEWLRGEMVGPSRPLSPWKLATFTNGNFSDEEPMRKGPLAWLPPSVSTPQEVLYFVNETPHRKYGAGMLHPEGSQSDTVPAEEIAVAATDTIGVDLESVSLEEVVAPSKDSARQGHDAVVGDEEPPTDEFETVSADIRHPSTIGLSFCARLGSTGRLLINLPQVRRFPWQRNDADPFAVNGRYEACKRKWSDEHGASREVEIWRRHSAFHPDTVIAIDVGRMSDRKVIRSEIEVPNDSPIALRIEVFPRKLEEDDVWLFTVVLRNSTATASKKELHHAILYQMFLEVRISDGTFVKYPESQRPFEQLDDDEQTLALLYRESATWAVGHGCAAAWDSGPGQEPESIYLDAMPAVELPSMTPDIDVNGQPIRLSMRELAQLSADGVGDAWRSLDDLAAGYKTWIEDKRAGVSQFESKFAQVADRHLDVCVSCHTRILTGISLLRSDDRIRRAFRLANLAMLLQQIATKQLNNRPLVLDGTSGLVVPSGAHKSPWHLYAERLESAERLGSWRAFQIAFLLMSIAGVSDIESSDREVVDLVWFPTGGGKTEAYLAVAAFYMFHQRLLQEASATQQRDGTNVLMRYTLRMLTTQQFQRAASLICAMEYMRRNGPALGIGPISGKRFSLGLWIGGDGSPNRISDARRKLAEYRTETDKAEGNPLVLGECPWCRAEIGRFDGPMPRRALRKSEWNFLRTRGITDDRSSGPLLHCPDKGCEFGRERVDHWLPIEVIDERIYAQPPSLVIATADKLAMIAYRPEAASLFGRRVTDSRVYQDRFPPSLIIQDELHLISGPLGTMYALYEGIIERLCSVQVGETWIRPKIIASTATIRGAADQVRSLYARGKTALFPSPGLMMADSFFGKYARQADGRLCHGRMYLGIHASDYGSILTAQVRAFSAALFRPWALNPSDRDPWWTLLAFYNSIRELSGARTLFDSDIRSRLKYLFNREGFDHDNRRNLRPVEELTSRLSQTGIVRMMERLATPYHADGKSEMLDACLASNIIEVGIDIERLSLMGVVGQPKATATYIQVTGRVGRRWWDRPGLILMIYNPSKSRDRSHFEQFHSYHRRLYERVEPTTATPFAVAAVQRGVAGVLIAWARQHRSAQVQNRSAFEEFVNSGYQLLRERCEYIQIPQDRERSLAELGRVRNELLEKWKNNPQLWSEYPPKIDGEYLMLWPSEYYSDIQRRRGVVVQSSLRNVDRSAELEITQAYTFDSVSEESALPIEATATTAIRPPPN